MTHQERATAPDRIAELLAENGFDALDPTATVLPEEAMKIERPHAL